jgi:ATP-dependent Lon protease
LGEVILVDLLVLIFVVIVFVSRVRERDPSFEFPLPRDAAAGVVADLCAHHLMLDARERQLVLETLEVGPRVRRVTEALALQRLALSHDPRDLN